MLHSDFKINNPTTMSQFPTDISARTCNSQRVFHTYRLPHPFTSDPLLLHTAEAGPLVILDGELRRGKGRE
jgi:hypothetical protein